MSGWLFSLLSAAGFAVVGTVLGLFGNQPHALVVSFGSTGAMVGAIAGAAGAIVDAVNRSRPQQS